MTSEEQHGIPPQPGPLCYQIDFGVYPALETGDVLAGERALTILRQEIITLRAWGEAWKQKALNLKTES